MRFAADTAPTLDVTTDIPALLLVGGMGTRLQAILPSTPKPLARVGESPFVELLLLQLRAQGIRRVVMCTGHLADQIEQYFADGRNWGMTIDYSHEVQPLGTAGAVRLAARFLANTPDFLVMNGDSFLELDFDRFITFHREHAGLMTMAVREVPSAARYGTVELDSQNRITEFREKTGASSAGLINGGVYVFRRDILDQIPEGPASLEKDVFPRLLDCGVYGLQQNGMFIDIGTPEDYERAQSLSRNLREAVHAKLQ